VRGDAARRTSWRHGEYPGAAQNSFFLRRTAQPSPTVGCAGAKLRDLDAEGLTPARLLRSRRLPLEVPVARRRKAGIPQLLREHVARSRKPRPARAPSLLPRENSPVSPSAYALPRFCRTRPSVFAFTRSRFAASTAVATHPEHAVGTPPQAHGVATAGTTMRSAPRAVLADARPDDAAIPAHHPSGKSSCRPDRASGMPCTS
jgi:hypothetical protein